MKIFIDFNHPAHVHLFKHFITEMKGRGHEFLLSARDKDCSYSLLDSLGLSYIKRKGYRGLLKIPGLILIDYKLYRHANAYNPNLLIGGPGNAYITHIARLLKKPSYIFDDTEHSRLQNLLTFPFAQKVITPSCFTLDIGKKQIRHNSCHELAYLHPQRFTPDPSVLSHLSLEIDSPFIIVRFVDWQASHDIMDRGIRNKTDFIKALSKHARVFISSEYPLPDPLREYGISLSPILIHHLLSFSSLYIGESATMASESALLGIPAVYISRSTRGYIQDLSSYGLVHHIEDTKEAIEKALAIIHDKGSKSLYQGKRLLMLKEKTDLTAWMTDFFSSLN